ncbi:TIGR04104 family putative zinc finger protein [Piscibacillus sp. B03]|uniref:TIGR04104 family putative zinc finger protein n=1 Tax=Piscibacillus sp. B03 TaxID=3457430 RepID=UPI003FCCE9F7
MPTCQKCHTEWTWKDSQKVIFQFKKGLICPYCGETQYQTSDSQKRTSLVGMAPLLMLPVVILTDSWFLTISLILLASITHLSVIPFLMKLSNNQELMW